MRSAIFSAILIAVSIVIALVLCEGAYRYVLYSKHPTEFANTVDTTERPAVWFMEKSRWQFHKDYGYAYGPETIYGGSAQQGNVRSCWSWPANKRGNMGLIRGDYDSADFKVLVFGDSFTAQIDTGPDLRGISWPDYLQDYLSASLGRSVHVVNFGRDGTGLLHMMDLAKDMVPQWKPDLVLFSFITDDLTRDRFWRTQTTIAGRERALTTTVPEADPPIRYATDTAIVHSGATRSWCAQEQKKKSPSDDPILRAMEKTVLEAKARSQGKPDVTTLDRSFLYDRFVHGTPFHSTYNTATASQNPRHKMNSFLEDKRFTEGLKAIKSLGIPIGLTHLSTYDELKVGNRMTGSSQDDNLITSLQEAFGVGVIYTADFGKVDVGDLEKIKRSPQDTHPSVFGMQYYARAIADGLAKGKYLPR